MQTIHLRSGVAEYSDAHRPGMRVPRGGSSCSNCRLISADRLHCTSPEFIAWRRGDDRLPAPADEYCSDWYEPPR